MIVSFLCSGLAVAQEEVKELSPREKRQQVGTWIAWSGGVTFIGAIAFQEVAINRRTNILLTPSSRTDFDEVRKQRRALAGVGTALNLYTILAIGGGATYAHFNSEYPDNWVFAGSMMTLGGATAIMAGSMQHAPLTNMSGALEDQSSFNNEAEFNDVLGRYSDRRRNGFILYGVGGGLIATGMTVTLARAFDLGTKERTSRTSAIRLQPTAQFAANNVQLGVQGSF